MKKIILINSFVLTAAFFFAGCQTSIDWTGGKAARQRASDVTPSVQRLHDARKADVTEINERYRQSSARLMEELEAYERLGRLQANYDNVQSAADSVQMDWEKQTLKTELHALFQRHVQQEIAGLDAMYASLAESRKLYADSYQEASLKLKKLKDLELGLQQLSKPQGLSKDAQDFFKALANAAREAAEEQQKSNK